MTTWNDALATNAEIRRTLSDLWRSDYGNRPEQLCLTADKLERDMATLVAYLRWQADNPDAP
jgi:hypothetical protein